MATAGVQARTSPSFSAGQKGGVTTPRSQTLPLSFLPAKTNNVSPLAMCLSPYIATPVDRLCPAFRCLELEHRGRCYCRCRLNRTAGGSRNASSRSLPAVKQGNEVIGRYSGPRDNGGRPQSQEQAAGREQRGVALPSNREPKACEEAERRKSEQAPAHENPPCTSECDRQAAPPDN
jgi:hypothetical protein